MITPTVLEVSAAELESVATGINMVWALTVTFLIFFMHAGFAMLEAGQVRSKNVANQLTKNMLTWAVGIGVFFVIGMGVANNIGSLLGGGETTALTMFGADHMAAYTDSAAADGWVMWLFSAVFAMTAATIVSGAVAGRAKLRAYVGYTFLLAAVIYPVVSGMVWYAPGGTPLLTGLGYADFAGGMVVHGVGGVAGLTAAYVLGARMDKYDDDGSVNVIPGHSMTFAVLGTLILCFGWFGFNVGTAAQPVALDGSGLASFAEVGSVAAVTALGMGLGAIGAAAASIYISMVKPIRCTSQTVCWPVLSVSLAQQTLSPRWVRLRLALSLARNSQLCSGSSNRSSRLTMSVLSSRFTGVLACLGSFSTRCGRTPLVQLSSVAVSSQAGFSRLKRARLFHKSLVSP